VRAEATETLLGRMQEPDMGYHLGIDVGTTYTAAAVHRDGRVEIETLGDRAASIPSVVFLREDSTVLTGEAAARRAVTEPGRVAREFKRRVGDSTPVLLAGSPFSAEHLIANLLRAVLEHTTSAEGSPPDRVAITHPANWGLYKIDLLSQAVRLADLPSADLLTEPQAAAIYYASCQRIEPGEAVAVYDLGGGTFDAAVLRRTDDAFEILGEPEGIERLGGIDFDEAVFAHVRAYLGGAFEQLDAANPVALSAVARLREDCVAAKEALSTDTEVTIAVLLPTVQTEVRLRRSEFEDMIRPALTETIGSLRRALRSAEVDPSDIKAVLLVGGASRIPLVAELVTGELGRPVAVDAHPKHAVALGAALACAVAAGHDEQPTAVVAAAEAMDRRPAVSVSTVVMTEPPLEGFWFYVEESQLLIAADDSTRFVGTLSPGIWYQAHSEQSGWVWACDDRGIEGWVPSDVVRRYS
jgi:molecular chaperone DnaK